MCFNTTFIWNDNFSKISDLFENMLGKDRLLALTSNPPQYFSETDLTWLENYTTPGSGNEQIKNILKQQFLNVFTHIRLYHACCPNSVNSYYIKGFIPLDPEEQEMTFKESFSPYVSEEDILDAIQYGNEYLSMLSDTHLERRKRVYFAVDKNYIDEKCGIFMCGGEYIGALINRLKRVGNACKQKIFLSGRIPTVFIVDMPINEVNDDHLFWILGHIACKWVCTILKNESYNFLTGGINFSQVDKQYIHDHYHLKEIICSQNPTPPIILNAYCDKCQTKKKISVIP